MSTRVISVRLPETQIAVLEAAAKTLGKDKSAGDMIKDRLDLILSGGDGLLTGQLQQLVAQQAAQIDQLMGMSRANRSDSRQLASQIEDMANQVTGMRAVISSQNDLIQAMAKALREVRVYMAASLNAQQQKGG